MPTRVALLAFVVGVAISSLLYMSLGTASVSMVCGVRGVPVADRVIVSVASLQDGTLYIPITSEGGKSYVEAIRIDTNSFSRYVKICSTIPEGYTILAIGAKDIPSGTDSRVTVFISGHAPQTVNLSGTPESP